jgi:hypothetical protein
MLNRSNTQAPRRSTRVVVHSRWVEEALAIGQTIGMKRAMAENQEALGEIAYAQGRFSAAEAHGRQELAIWHQFGNRAYLSLSSACCWPHPPRLPHLKLCSH